MEAGGGWAIRNCAYRVFRWRRTARPFCPKRAEAAEAVATGGAKDIEALRERVRLAVRRTATRWTGKKPIVDVLIIDI